MLPRDLKPEQFSGYPPLAQRLATGNLQSLRNLPLSFLPSLLREMIEFDYKFPAERRSLERELANLKVLSESQWKEWFSEFAAIHLSSSMEKFDWVNQPAQFVEQLSAHLWTTHQQDAFRKAATEYGDRLRAAVPPEDPKIPRVAIAVVGQGVPSSEYPLFRKLRAHGAFYTKIDAKGGLNALLDFASVRAKTNPIPYAHWYIDGGQPAACDSSLTCISYRALDPARNQLLAKMQKQSEAPGSGPENLRTVMAALRPSDLKLDHAGDPVLSRFELKLLTEGSGTQIFSTTFAQWAARETLRRAQPLTLMVRFAPRQRQRPMSEMLSVPKETLELDPQGSLVDADFGAYYTWLNQQRLTGAAQASFIAWFEEHGTAIAIGPTVPRGTVSNSSVDLKQVLSWTV
ncbi:MAG: hypothetical protein JSS69_03335 [Acidobacteria bacterium]|nr:hypothetical protein [Acidobacteriota bacterium]MBS1864927.1 hypothetical protein [Acidobacteriota bacterium]